MIYQTEFRKHSAQVINRRYLLCLRHLIGHREWPSLYRIYIDIDLRPVRVCALFIKSVSRLRC